MPRVKPTPILITRAQVDSNLQRYGLIQDRLESLRADHDAAVSNLRKSFDQAVAPLTVEAAQIEAEINHHIRSFSADFVPPARSIKLRFGQIGMRKIRKDALKIANKLRDAIIQRLRALNLNDCILQEPKIDVRALAKYPDSVIDQIDGVSRPPESDEPWFEAFREPISA